MEVDIIVMAGLAIPVLGLLVEHFHYNSNLQERMGKIETKVDLFWGALETRLPDMLLKGNPLPPDSKVAILLEIYKDGKITHDEIPELVNLLDEETRNPEHSAGELLALVLMNATIHASNGDYIRGQRICAQNEMI